MRADTPVTSIRDLAPPLTRENMVPSQAGGKEETHTHTHTHTKKKKKKRKGKTFKDGHL